MNEPEHFDQHGIMRARGQRRIELGLDGQVVGAELAGAAAFHFGESRLKRFAFLFGRALDEAAPGHFLQRRSHFIDRFGVFGSVDRNDRAAMRDDLDHAFGFELAQRFAQQRAADIQHFAQFTFDQPVSR